MLDPNALLKPLDGYIVEDLDEADIVATDSITAAILDELADPVQAILSATGDEGITCTYIADPEDESTPGTLVFWPTPEDDDHTPEPHDARHADYSLHLSVFLAERDDDDVVYPAGVSMVLKLNEEGCELVKFLPPAVFEQLEFRIKGGSLPAGFAFLDDKDPIPVLPNMRKQFMKAISRAHDMTERRRGDFESVMAHYIWDNTEPVAHFGAVLTTLATLLAAVHHKAVS